MLDEEGPIKQRDERRDAVITPADPLRAPPKAAAARTDKDAKVAHGARYTRLGELGAELLNARVTGPDLGSYCNTRPNTYSTLHFVHTCICCLHTLYFMVFAAYTLCICCYTLSYLLLHTFVARAHGRERMQRGAASYPCVEPNRPARVQ